MKRSCYSPVVVAIAIAGILVSACVSNRPVKYYRIEIPEPPTAVSGTSFDLTLQVDNIDAPPLMRDGRILYRVGTHEMGAYEYHRWVETPDRIVQNSLIRLLRASHKYRSVDTPRSNVKADFILQGKIYEFAEIDKPQIYTRVSMEIELHDQKSNRTVWSHLYAEEKMVEGKEIEDVVESLDQNMREGLTEIVNGLNQYFDGRANPVSRLP